MTQGRSARTLGRDFKDVRRHAPAAPGPAFGGWTGFAAGLGLGLAIAFTVHVYHRNQQAVVAGPVPEPSQTPASAAAADDGAIADTTAAPELDFYDMLPKQEVEVPGQVRPEASSASNAPLPTGDVVLQAGSFKQATEAEKMQAELALLGISAKIQRASVDDETWYRVRIGPIATVEELRNVQSKLREAEITATAVTPAE